MKNLLRLTPSGLYCEAGDFYIDPWRKVQRAIITHAHADHARKGMGAYLSTPLTAPILRHRLGTIKTESIEYGVKRKIGDATVSLHPAGHLPGSAQIRIEIAGEIAVVSGDYKTQSDGLSTAFTPLKCHHFVTESTFGLPVFNWPAQEDIAAQIRDWWEQCQSRGQMAFLGCYSLGKAQRLLHLLSQKAPPNAAPILCHGAIDATNKLFEKVGLDLPQTQIADPETAPRGALILCPPAAFGSAWAKKFGPSQTAMASGWMQLRGVKRRGGLSRGFVISDHADWTGLCKAVHDTGAENIYVTHGYTEIFTKYLNEIGKNALRLETQFESEDSP